VNFGVDYICALWFIKTKNCHETNIAFFYNFFIGKKNKSMIVFFYFPQSKRENAKEKETYESRELKKKTIKKAN